jgi:hypothetical protein
LPQDKPPLAGPFCEGCSAISLQLVMWSNFTRGAWFRGRYAVDLSAFACLKDNSEPQTLLNASGTFNSGASWCQEGSAIGPSTNGTRGVTSSRIRQGLHSHPIVQCQKNSKL